LVSINRSYQKSGKVSSKKGFKINNLSNPRSPVHQKVLALVFSCAVVRLDGVIVEVEFDSGDGLPGITTVGLPDAAVQAAKYV
jgi:hypothetical protein